MTPLPSRDLLRDRFRGALLGLAAGEALGAPAEFLTAEQVVEKYGVVTEMIGGGVYEVAPGEITDATEMMLCLAESLADNGHFEPEDIMARYGDWLASHPRHVSLTVRAALISDAETAALSRQHNDVNVLCLSGKNTAPDLARKILAAFINARFEGGRHERRVLKMDARFAPANLPGRGSCPSCAPAVRAVRLQILRR